MRSHHKVCIDEDTHLTKGLDWFDRVPVDEQVEAWAVDAVVLLLTPQMSSMTEEHEVPTRTYYDRPSRYDLNHL